MAFVVALAIVPLLVRFAVGRDLLEVPNARSAREVLTPRLSNLTVIACVCAAAPFMNEGLLMMLVAESFAGAVGLLDDVLDLVTRALLHTSGLVVCAGFCRPLSISALNPAVYQKLCADYLIQG